MSLDYYLDKIKDYKNLCWVPVDANYPDGDIQLSAVTHSLVWRTMVVDIGKITEANVDEFCTRMWTYDALFDSKPVGEWVKDDNDKDVIKWRSVTYEEVLAHVGLQTNVMTLTDAKWRKHLMMMIDVTQIRDAKWKVREAKKELEKVEVK